MKKRILFVVIALVFVFLLTGCSNSGTKTVEEKVQEMQSSDSRFVIIGEEKIIYPNRDGLARVHIMVDRDTMVMYMFTNSSKYFSGISPLIGEDGEPMKYTGDFSELFQ